MDADALFNKQKEWSEQGLLLLRELLPLMSPIGRYREWTPEERDTLGSLISACARSSESVMLLCAYGQVWDADVVSRSVFEGTLKLMYLLQGRENFKQRHTEYANDLFDIALLKDHKKAQDVLNIVSDSQAKEWKPIRERLLSSDERTDIEQRYDKATRRALETKWGFTGLIGTLCRSGDPLFAGLSALYHGYSISSHILHADYVGVSIPLERDRRSEERREAVLLGHLTRLIMDQLVCLHMRLFLGYRYVGHSPEPLADVGDKIRRLKEGFGGVYESWLDIEYGGDKA